MNQVRPEKRGSGGESTVTDLVSVHLKDLDSGEIRFLKKVVQMEDGAEGGPLTIEGYCMEVGDMTALYGCL